MKSASTPGPKKEKTLPGGLRRYQVKGTDLMHNGKTIRENFFIELTDEEAEPLKNILILKK